jgi:predicted nucleic acid-binding protein
MDQIVIDANLITKWYITEQNSDKAEILREKFVKKEFEIILSPLYKFEVLNALKYSNLFTQSELNSIGESLESYGFKVISIQNKIRENMVNILMDYDLTIYDASYVALATEMSCLFCTGDTKN